MQKNQVVESDKIEQDFNRDVWCLFGLPVDNLTMHSAKTLLRDKSTGEGGVVLSTINVNWVVQSFFDPQFRKAIINSDIVTLDGKPLLWLAKLLGYPMVETVAGSSLIQELHQDENTKKPFSLFLFGGEKGVAKRAMAEINKNRGGLKVVGAIDPGFGSVEEMSSDKIISEINRSQPDILLIALGAKKGTQWIERNRERLNAKIISHLGATINFLAGTVRRAPIWIRQSGVEWVWRIAQEPKLFSRYAYDGMIMTSFLISHFRSWRQFLSLKKYYCCEKADIDVRQTENEKEITLSFGRNILLAEASPIRILFCNCVRSNKEITLDFGKTKFVDSAFMGLLSILMKHQHRNSCKLNIINVGNELDKVFHLCCGYTWIKKIR